AVRVERDWRRCRGEREVAPACADLVETYTDARIAPARKTHGGEASGGGQCGHHRPEEKIGGRNFRAPRAFSIEEGRTGRDGHQGYLRRRIGIGERAANGSARTGCGMPDERHDLGEPRERVMEARS